MSNLTLNTKVYSGRGIRNGVSSWLYMIGGLLASIAQVTANIVLPSVARKGSNDGAKVKVDWRLRVPIVAEEATSCACPGTVIDEIDVYIQVRATQGVTEAVRTDFALQVKDLVASSDFQNSIISFTQPTA